jgi:photosystem II stability/assembly factor-like uncharacterized protein
MRTRCWLLASFLLGLGCSSEDGPSSGATAATSGDAGGRGGAGASTSGSGSGSGGMGGFDPEGDPPILEPGVWTDVSPPRDAEWPVWGLALDPSNTATIYAYVCGDEAGVYRSKNAGSTWELFSQPGCATGVAVDPDDSDHVYVSYALFSGTLFGFWETKNGGRTWDKKDLLYGEDVGRFAVDPGDFDHILLSFHYVGDDAAGVMQSFDGGDTWAPTGAAPWGYGGTKGAHFLSDSDTWVISTEAGLFRTENGGESFDTVGEGFFGTHGGNTTTYKKSDGTVYIAGYPAPIRSTDDGETWESIWTQNASYFRSLVGDGNLLYTGFDVPESSIYTAPEGDDTNWTQGTQTLENGPCDMAFDPAGRIVYIANRHPGVMAMKVAEP